MAGITAVSWPPDGPARSEMPGAGAVLRQVVLKAGHVAGRHQHDHEQFLFVVSGGGRLLCKEGNIELDPGTALDLPRALDAIGEAELDAGQGVPHSKVREWLARRGTGERFRRPRASTPFPRNDSILPSWSAEADHPRLCRVTEDVDGRPPPTMTESGRCSWKRCTSLASFAISREAVHCCPVRVAEQVPRRPIHLRHPRRRPRTHVLLVAMATTWVVGLRRP